MEVGCIFLPALCRRHPSVSGSGGNNGHRNQNKKWHTGREEGKHSLRNTKAFALHRERLRVSIPTAWLRDVIRLTLSGRLGDCVWCASFRGDGGRAAWPWMLGIYFSSQASKFCHPPFSSPRPMSRGASPSILSSSPPKTVPSEFRLI